MLQNETHKNYTILTAISTAFGLIGLILPATVPLTWIAGAIYGLGCAWLTGSLLFREDHPVWKITLGSFVFIAAWSAIAGTTYQLYCLNFSALMLLTILIPAALLLLSLRYGPKIPWHLTVHSPGNSEIKPFRTILGTILGLFSLTATSIGFWILRQSSTDISIRSPWDTVPSLLFVLFFMAVLVALGLALSGSLGNWAVIPLSLAALLSVSIAVITYSVGFGFDPFIHQATENVIYAIGNITPKPLYYSGQYALVVSIAKLTKIDLISIDRWLGPLVFAGLIPLISWCLRRAFSWKPAIAVSASAVLLLLPLSPFVATTPQGLANIMAIAALFSALPSLIGNRASGPSSKLLPILFASAAAITHPLTGLPLLVFIAVWMTLTLGIKPKLWNWTAAAVIAILGSVALPVAFMFNSSVSGIGVDWTGQSSGSTAGIVTELITASMDSGRHFLPALDIAYLWEHSCSAAFWILGLIGLAMLWKRNRATVAYAFALAALLGNWLILKTSANFDFLIEYERADYVNRLSDLFLYMLAPAATYTLGIALIRIRRSFPVMRMAAVVILSVFVTSSMYLAYPRRDSYESSRGWSTSGSDIEAVRIIETDAGDRPYVVLANQSVSAAAIREIGFSRYLQSKNPAQPEEIYFYPIPTGGPLYSIFLEMNDSLADPENVEKAMDLTGVDTVYYVVNDYWWQARKIVSSANRSADDKWVVDGHNYIFRYDK